MKTHYCIYQAGKTNIETACFADEGETLKSPYSGELFDDLLIELNDKRETGSPAFQIMPLEKAFPLIQEAQRAKYCNDWQEITEEEWYENLEVLPPEKWETLNGIEFFRMMETLTGNITAHYAKTGTRYFTANRERQKDYAALWFEVNQALLACA
jgi:hypothetical protein